MGSWVPFASSTFCLIVKQKNANKFLEYAFDWKYKKSFYYYVKSKNVLSQISIYLCKENELVSFSKIGIELKEELKIYTGTSCTAFHSNVTEDFVFGNRIFRQTKQPRVAENLNKILPTLGTQSCCPYIQYVLVYCERHSQRLTDGLTYAAFDILYSNHLIFNSRRLGSRLRTSLRVSAFLIWVFPSMFNRRTLLALSWTIWARFPTIGT